MSEPAVSAAPRLGWRARAVLVVSLCGLAVSTYLTLTHYTSVVPLACASRGPIDCGKVTTSAQSIVFGIPVAVLGLVYFVTMVVLGLPVVFRRQTPLIAAVRLGSSIVGVGFVSYLLYCELYVIHAICLWCSSVHLLTFILFVLIVTGWDELGAGTGAIPDVDDLDRR